MAAIAVSVSERAELQQEREDLPPPLKVLLMPPIMADVVVVLKKARKLGLAITSVITPASYPFNKRLSQNPIE